MAIASLTFLDYSNERKPVVFNVANPTDTTLDDTISDITALVLAYQDISGGILNRRQLTIVDPVGSGLPANPEAQREKRWVVGYTDVTTSLAVGVANPLFGENFTFSIPCANLTAAMLQTNSDYADLTNSDMADFVTAIEAFVRSPSGGAIEVTYIKFNSRKG